MQKNMTDRTPGSYDDFVAYLGTVRTEEELFSRLTYWFAGQNRPEDVLSRSELVEARAKELGFWQGLTFRMERWLTDGKSELEAVGREEFQSRIAEDYAAYREKADAARARFRDRRRAAPLSFTPDCLENVPIQNVSWLVEGLLPMGEVSLLGADGGTGKKDADFVEERRIRTAQTKEDTAQTILDILSESKTASMGSEELRAEVLKQTNCSSRTFDYARAELKRAGKIKNVKLREKDGRNKNYTLLAYCGETACGVGNI